MANHQISSNPNLPLIRPETHSTPPSFGAKGLQNIVGHVPGNQDNRTKQQQNMGGNAGHMNGSPKKVYSHVVSSDGNGSTIVLHTGRPSIPPDMAVQAIGGRHPNMH